MNPYRALADAIILQAVDDYRKHKKLRCSIAKFFKSDWFKVLTDVDGEYLLKKLKDELNQNKGGNING
jgi:hypothetical protein